MLWIAAALAAISLAMAGCVAETKYVPVGIKRVAPAEPRECTVSLEGLPDVPVPAVGDVVTPEQWEAHAWAVKAVHRRNDDQTAICRRYHALLKERPAHD
jgi:hypothetical protein